MTRIGHGLSPDAYGDIADSLVAALRARGCVPVAVPRMYTHTLLIDLAHSEADLLASFGSTCRQHIRAPAKLGLRAEPITDERFAHRLAALDAETMTRRGGQVRPIDWSDMLKFVRNEPTHAMLIGISRPESTDERALLDRVARSASGLIAGVRARKR